jgi:hypothetical protein
MPPTTKDSRMPHPQRVDTSRMLTQNREVSHGQDMQLKTKSTKPKKPRGMNKAGRMSLKRVVIITMLTKRPGVTTLPRRRLARPEKLLPSTQPCEERLS